MKAFLTKCGLSDISSITDTIEQSEMELNELEDKINEILQKCGNVLIENLKDSNFSKIDKDKIALTLSQEEVKTIMLKLLEELKNNVALLGNYEEEIQAEIEDLIDEFSEIETTEDGTLKIIVDRSNNKLSNIEIQVSEYTIMNIQVENSKITIILKSLDGEDTSIVVEKVKEESSVNYNISCSQNNEDTNLSFYINMKFLGIATNNAEENYVIGFNIGDPNSQLQYMSYQYTFNTNKTFVDTIEIESLTSENSVILNDCTEEYINTLLPAIVNRIAEINQEQMKTLGVTQNPLIMATPMGYIYSMMNDVITQQSQSEMQRLDEMSEMEMQRLDEMSEMTEGFTYNNM